MKRECVLAPVNAMLIGGCRQANAETAEEERFVERPGCETTDLLVRARHEAAIPLIVPTLDARFRFKTSPAIRLAPRRVYWYYWARDENRNAAGRR